MKKLILSGKIETDYVTNWNKILLIQSDGYKIDLIGRFSELQLNTVKGIQVNYHISDSEKSLSELKEELILRTSGALESEYRSDEYYYSSWTQGGRS